MTICVGIGQCGVSCTDSLLQCLSSEEENDYFYFLHSQRKTRPRAVLIDTEPKAIDKCICSSRSWSYDAQSTHILGQSGAGNNWGCGYHILNENKIGIIETVQKEAERYDQFDSLSIQQSAAGGTGSGLGAALTEDFRDAFPNVTLMNAVICPFIIGEVIVQHYNACFSLAHLIELSDGVFLIENESISSTCTSMLQIKQPSFTDMNNLISLYLSTSLLSTTSLISNNSSKLHDAIAHLCCHPGYKIFNGMMVPITPSKSVEFTTDNWLALSKRLFRIHGSGHRVESDILWDSNLNNVSIANALTIHGRDAYSGWHEQGVKSIWNTCKYPCWQSNGLIVNTRNRSFNSYDKSMTLLSNSQSIIAPIDRLNNHAYEMFLSRAYVHQYSKFGIEFDDFLGTFAKLEQVLHNYKSLS